MHIKAIITLSLLTFLISIQVNAGAFVEKDSDDLKNNVVYKESKDGKKVEITFTVPDGFSPAVYVKKKMIDVKTKENTIFFSVDKNDLTEANINLHKDVSGGGLKCPTFYRYNFKLSDYYTTK